MNTLTKQGSRINYLKEDEVPVSVRHAYDFESQMIEHYVGQKSRVTTIKRTCLVCGNEKRIRAASVRDCIREGILRGVCQPCGRKLSKPMPKGSKSSQWKGGRTVTTKGYVLLHRPEHPYSNNGYVQEHRLVMEQYIGRILLPTETVHHKNGIKTDNTIDNLELWTKSHSDGCRYEDLSVDQIKDLIKHLQSLLLSSGKKQSFGLPAIPPHA